MVNFTILAGGFAVPGFIATYNFDSEAGSLSLLGQSSTGDSPSWIAQHPQNRSILYAVNEISPVGDLQSFTIGEDGSVTLVDTVTSGGNGPTFSAVLSTGEVSAMNFGSPNCSFVATVEGDPLHFRTDSPVVSFTVPEGATSHPHMSLEHNGEIFVPDLGQDKIWRIVRDGEPGHFKIQGQIDIDPGTGPRHIAIQGAFSVRQHFIHPPRNRINIDRPTHPEAPNGTTLPLLANVSIIPENALPGTQFAAAEILISTPTDKFPNPLIYVSNRNISPNVTDPNGDTIAIFEFINGTDSNNNTAVSTSSQCSRKRMVKRAQRLFRREGEALKLLAQVPTGLQQIRSMALGRVDDGGMSLLLLVLTPRVVWLSSNEWTVEEI
ncbi:hypothetical protein D9758_012695 [Tetrapyrgos nigripes]|uniref:Isomerase YbhE n=1 Tax=Tetrapyrgos nigripes TaxID=182062 RepID=A0A8H5CYP3_9AGAR|nr:hypothetical protein D9758_012695 [Tetrapyrgos nigripes]